MSISIRTVLVIVCSVVCVCILTPDRAFSQGITATLSVDPFPTPYLSDWELNPNLVQASLRNDSNETVQLRLVVSIDRDGSGVIATGSSSLFALDPGADETYLTPDLIDYESVEYDGSFEEIVVRTGRLPEGRYELCVRIEDEFGALLAEEVCMPMDILYPDPPYLLFPFDGDTVTTQFPIFQWQPIQVPAGYPIDYSITVAEQLDYQTPLRALTETEYYQFQTSGVDISSLSYPIDALPLENDKKYVWQVRVLDQDGYPPASNDGKSEIWTFVYSDNGESAIAGSDQTSIRIVPAGQESTGPNILSSLNGGTFEAVKAEWERIRTGGEVVIPLPGLGDFAGFSVTSVGVSFNTEHKVIAFRGKAERYNEPNAEILLTLKWDKGLKAALSIKLPDFSFGGVFLEFASYGRFRELATDFAVIIFSNDEQTLSSKVLPSGVKDFFDTLTVPVKSGMNFHGVINLNRTPWFERVVNFIGVKSNQVVLTGHGGPVKNLLTKKAAKDFDLSLGAKFPAIISPEFKLWLKSRQFELKGGVKRALAEKVGESPKDTTADTIKTTTTDTSMVAQYTPYIELKETLTGSFGNGKERSFYRSVELEQETTDSNGTVVLSYGTDDTLHLGLPWLNIRDVKLSIVPDEQHPKASLFGGIDIGDVKVSESLYVEIGLPDTTAKTKIEGSRKKDSTYRQADSVSVTASGSTKKFSFRAKAQLAEGFRLGDLIKIATSTLPREERGGGLTIPEGVFDLSNLALGFGVGAQNEFFFTGSTTLMQSETDFLLSLARDDQQKRLFTVGVKPVAWQLTKAIPALSNPVLDNINFSRVGFVITNQEATIGSSDLGPDTYEFYKKIYLNDEYTLVLKPGINLIATIPLDNMSPDDPLITIMDHLGMESGTIMLQGTFGNVFGLMTGQGGGGMDLIKDIYLTASLPPMNPPGSPEWFKSGVLALEVTGQPSVGVIGAITVDINGDVLTFFVQGKIARDGPGVALAIVGGMEAEEPWVAPFGIKFLTMNKVVLKVSVNAYGNIGLGFAGDLKIGEKDIKSAVAVAINAYTGAPTNAIFDGESDEGLALYDIAKLQNQMAAAATGGEPPMLPIDAVPDMAIKKMGLKFAPKSDPDLGVEAGMAIKGDLHLATSPGGPLKNVAGVDCAVGVEGIWAKGHLARFELGPLTWEDALLDFQLKLGDSHFFLDGEVDLLGSMKMVHLAMTRDSLAFASETEIDGLYKTSLVANGAFNLTSPAFAVAGELQNDFGEALAGPLSEGLARFASAGQEAIDAALDAYEKAEALSAQKELAVEELKKRLEGTREIARKAMLEAKSDRDAARPRMDAARKAKDAAWKAYRGIPARKVREKAAALRNYRAKLTAYGRQVAAYTRVNAVYVGKLAVYNAVPDPDNNPALLALKGQADKLWEKLESQKANLEKLQAFYRQINNHLASASGPPISIRKASFESSLKNLVNREGVEVHLEMMVLDQYREMDVNITFENIGEAVKSILEGLIRG